LGGDKTLIRHLSLVPLVVNLDFNVAESMLLNQGMNLRRGVAE
jgi:hypothetical protein